MRRAAPAAHHSFLANDLYGGVDVVERFELLDEACGFEEVAHEIVDAGEFQVAGELDESSS